MNLYHYQQEQIKDLLLGRTVTKVADNSLILDDGTILRIHPNEGCGGCSSGWYDISELNDCPVNAIMNVEFSEEEQENGYDDYVYRIFVLAENQRIKLLEVEGSDGNGYYGSGYWIEIVNENNYN